MSRFAALPMLALILSATAAQAGGSARYPAPSGAPVHNYYGPVTVYNGGAPAYGADYAYPSGSAGHASAYGNTHAGAYAGAQGAYSGYGYYGPDYGMPWGEPLAGGVGYSPYGYVGSYGYGAVPVQGARMVP